MNISARKSNKNTYEVDVFDGDSLITANVLAEDMIDAIKITRAVHSAKRTAIILRCELLSLEVYVDDGV